MSFIHFKTVLCKMSAITFVLLFCLSTACFAQQFAGQRFAGRQAPAQNGSTGSTRMKVVQVQPQASQSFETAQVPSFITIVGAVKRSGVYDTTGPSVCLKDLIEAAGGMTEKASPSIRIIRNGYLRAQLYYNEQCTDDLKPGDIVVVVSKPQAFSEKVVKSDLIPVACVGLDARPVVLPLEPSIATVQHLTQRLLQHQELAQSAIVIDPLGRPSHGTLVPGSIVFFNPMQLNLVALDQVKQQQPFPAMLPMTPPTPEVDSTPPAAMQTTLLATPPVIAPAPQVPAEEFPEALPVETLEQQPANGSVAAPIPLFHEPNSVVTIEESLSLLNEEPLAHQSVSYETTLADSTSANSASFSTQESAPAPPFEEEISKSNARSLTDSAFVSIEPASTVRRTTTQSWVPVAMGVGILAVLCLGISLLWSRYERQQTRNLYETHRSHQQTDSAVAHHSDTDIEELLDNSLPMIEEQVIAPENIPLHGEPVGHRRIIVHEKHPSVAGPHFSSGKKQDRPEPVAMAARYDERELRDTLKEAFNSKPQPSLQSSSVITDEDLADIGLKPAESSFPLANSAKQSVSDESGYYDVVQPESIKAATVGSLERALNALSKDRLSRENLK